MQPSILSGKKRKKTQKDFSLFRAVIVGKKKSLGKVIHIHRQPQDPALHGASRRPPPSIQHLSECNNGAARNVFQVCFFPISLSF
jgi:hypothetical protein